MESKTQVFFIHGGETFKNDKDYLKFLKTRPISIFFDPAARWSEAYLTQMLGDECQIIKPRMPLHENSKYEEWKIHFERHFDQLTDNIILIGESLGGIFLAKYLSENKFPRKILSVYLIAPPFDDTMPDYDLVGGFGLGDDLSLIEENCENISLMFSEDDDAVPVSHSEKYKENLKNPKIIIYRDKNGHFQIQEFPEIVKLIKEDVKKLSL